jgi:hypothetical protein
VRRQRGEHDAECDVAEKGYFVRQGAERKPKARIGLLRLAAYTVGARCQARPRLGRAGPPRRSPQDYWTIALKSSAR